jgi:methyl-accepting chemotaxis protein
LSFLIGRSVSSPLGKMTDVMSQLAEGRTDVDVPATGNRDEIGDMARAVLVFKQNAEERAGLEAQQEEERAAKERRMAALEELVTDFDQSTKESFGALTSMAGKLDGTAASMTQAAETTQSLGANASAAVQQTTASVQTVASATEELTASIGEISRQVNESMAIAMKAVETARGTSETVRGLAQTSEKIGAVVSLIQDIAEQTNLLALNATIEAARAGDAGKGFAVVASEVKQLANQTGNATEEIAQQIAATQEITTAAVAAIGEVNGVIEHISEISTAIAGAVEEQGAATQDIAANLQQAAGGTNEVAEVVTRVNDEADHTSSAAQDVKVMSGDLSAQAEQIKGSIESFLRDVKAA